MNRYISAQVLTNKDGSMKAQRVYSIPKPAVISFYLDCNSLVSGMQVVGVLVQDWNTADCLDAHPDNENLYAAIEKFCGLVVLGVHRAK